MSNSLVPDQARQNVGPDLGPNCLQKLSVYETSAVCSINSQGLMLISGSRRRLWLHMLLLALS